MKRWWPVIVLAALIIAAYFLGFFDALTFENLEKHHLTIKETVAEHFVLMSIVYILLYVVITALSVPGASILTITGGYLFPMPVSVIYTVIGATGGATIIFLIARTSLGAFLKEKAGKTMKKMEEGFRKGEISYMLFLRFIPLFPFWLINIAPAFFGVRLITYVWTTFVGIIPGTYVYCQAGRGLDEIFASGKPFSLDTIFNTQIKIALIVLAVFAIIPIVVKKLRRDR